MLTQNAISRLTIGAALSTGLVLGSGCEIEQTRDAELPSVSVDVDAGDLPDYKVVKTDDGEMPGVDVDVEEGQMPAFDVEGPDVSIGEKKVEVTVPEVEVKTETKTMSVPTIDIDLPGDDESDK